MRHTPHYLMTDPGEVRRLIRNNPWATIVSPTSNGLVASHYPVLLEESTHNSPATDSPATGSPATGSANTDSANTDLSTSATGPSTSRLTSPASDTISIVSHFGRPDEQLHELGEHEVLVIIQGPHDYVSASWYEPGDLISTWNHVTAHLYGIPEILSEEENYAVLSRLTDHFEHGRPGGRSLSEDEAGTRRAAKGTVGLRLRVSRFDARAKLSQNKSAAVQERIVQELGVTNPALAEEMREIR